MRLFFYMFRMNLLYLAIILSAFMLGVTSQKEWDILNIIDSFLVGWLS